MIFNSPANTVALRPPDVSSGGAGNHTRGRVSSPQPSRMDGGNPSSFQHGQTSRTHSQPLRSRLISAVAKIVLFAVPNPLFDEIFTPFVNLTPSVAIFDHLFAVLMVSSVKSGIPFVNLMTPTVNLRSPFVVLPAPFVDSPPPFVISSHLFIKMITRFVNLSVSLAKWLAPRA